MLNFSKKVIICFTWALALLPSHATAFFWSRDEVDSNDPLVSSGEFTFDTKQIEIPAGAQVLDAELYVPSGQDPFAFVLFMPGFGASYKMYRDYLKHLASHGFLVAGLDFPSSPLVIDSEHDLKAEQALMAIEYIKNLDSDYSGLPAYTSGHSQGGKLAFYAASLNSDIRGVMALDPVNAGGPPCFIFPGECTNYPVAPNPVTKQRGIMYQMNDQASLIFCSEPDRLTNTDKQFNAEWFYRGSDGKGDDAAPSPALYYDFGGFSHTGYLPLRSSDEVQIIKRTMVAFLNFHVRGLDEEEYLTGSKIQVDVKAGRLEGVESR